MSSLYYGCSPYLNRGKKSLFGRKKKSGFVTYAGSGMGYGVRRSASGYAAGGYGYEVAGGGGYVAGRRSGVGSWLRMGRQASKNLAFGIAKTGEAMKEGTSTLRKAVETAKNIKSGKLKFEIGPASLVFGLVAVSVTMSLLYLAHYNSVATKGYDLRRLEADRQQLMTQYDIKNMKLAEAKSLAVIAASEKVENMRRPGEVTFVQGSTAIASR